MMVSEKESQTIRRFVCRQLRDEPDLSTLTIGILKRQYLEYVGHESLSSEAKHFMKQVVEEELFKMQDDDHNGSNSEAKIPKNKRKREEESDGESEDESRAKKSCRVSSSSSESEDEKESKTASDASEDEEQIKAGSRGAKKKSETLKKKTNKTAERQISSDDSSDDETKEAQMDNGLKEKGSNLKEPTRKKENTVTKGKCKSSKTSEDESDSDSKSEKSANRDSKESSDDDEDNNEKEGHATVKNSDEDSDSSSLPSIEDDEEADKPMKEVKKKKKEKKMKSVTKQETTKSERDGNKTIARLKHYITLCGVRRNYKKLFKNCHSIRSQVTVLRKELEDLGVEGLPSIEKCKKIKMKRERAQEIAELDVNNIICSQGRSKRGSVLNRQQKSPSSTYQRTLNSGSDSDQENKTHKTQRRTTDWRNLQGIISDDADSD